MEHNGGNRVFSCDFLRYVDAGLTIILFSNTSDMPAPDYSHPLARVALGLDYALPPKTIFSARLAAYAGTYALPSGTIITVTPANAGIALATTDQEAWGLLQSSGRGPAGDLVKKLNERTAAVLEAGAKGDFAPLKAAFGSNAPAGFEQRQAQMWKRQQDENGKLQSVRALGTSPDGPGLATTAELTFEHGKMYIQYMWSPEGELAGMLISDQLSPNRYSPESGSDFVSFTLPGPRVKRVKFTLDASGAPKELLLGPVSARKVQ
uniref:Uncharacterized protein n=1 Tax=Solibacter usitatus (strain Ellin6076) TaxID=234267 RepID=Q01WH5_SOLUE